MNARAIDDPAALGWTYDAASGRWTWTYSSGGGIEEAPEDGRQFGRQSGSWTPIVSGGGGSGGDDPRISNTQISNWDDAYSWGSHIDVGYVETETDPTVPSHVKNITLTDIANWNAGTGGGGGGGGVDPRITDTQINNWDDAHAWGDHSAQSYLTSASLSGYATQSWVNGQGYATTTWVSQNYQTKGSYAASNHNHNGVYAPASHTHNYAAVGASYTKAESDQKYELKGAGGGGSDTLQSVTSRGATTNQSCYAPNWHTQTDGYTLGGTSSGGARIIVLNGVTFTNKSGGATASISEAGTVSADDFSATSDRRKKKDIETAPTGVIERLRGVTFKWKDGRESSGVIAQEIQDAGLGHLVHKDDEGGLSVSYNGLLAYAIEELKLLRKELEELKRD